MGKYDEDTPDFGCGCYLLVVILGILALIGSLIFQCDFIL